MSSRLRHGLAAVAVVVASAPAIAAAHIALTYPTPRSADQFTAPCGNTTVGTRTVLEPGATINVTWNEVIQHPGHFRISFDADGVDFTIPLSETDQSQSMNVLLDGIADTTMTPYTRTVTLPAVECESCTLQLIQVISGNPPFDSNDIHFQCADLALRAPPGPDAGVPDAGAGADPDAATGTADDDAGLDDGDAGDDAADPGAAGLAPQSYYACSVGAPSLGTLLLLLGAIATVRLRRRRRRGAA
jgi:hypothetical protein